MFIIIFLLSVSFLAILLFLQHPLFGGKIDENYKEKYGSSPNFKNGVFHNRSHTPDLAEGVTYWEVLQDMFLSKTPNTKPIEAIPAIKTDLKSLDPEENVLVWLGHSSYYFQWKGLRFLVDPVLTPNASPVLWSNLAFEGTSIYGFEDIPPIDYLIITHDHYDHLDYTTVKKLKSKIKQIICPLGVSTHFQRWDFNPNSITELDWDQEMLLRNNLKIVAKSSRHFSGRKLKRNTTLWASFLLIDENFKIYLGGDSGYDSHFKEIGKEYGPIDLAILENGQYNKNWKYIHLMPEEMIQASLDLNAKNVLPVHSSKFKLANHAWDEPLEKVYTLGNNLDESKYLKVQTPRIGEILHLNHLDSTDFSPWWRSR